MRMKRIEMAGFKSFVDRTVIEFQHGITGIVGPNGCGKSNVVDAIRWVLGEQSSKNLRGKSMEDVIFAGSESRSPLGMAEVVLTFDNQDGRIGGPYASFGEISVGRRLFRSGESEYLVNKSPVRLRDVQEIFMDTGVGSRAHYAIIEQGKIGFVLSAKPEDRRILIEEAAGISKFRARKVAALRKIESTKQNLFRVQDVVAEVKRQMDYTQRQAAKARKYSEFKSEARQLDLQIWKVDYRKIAEEIKHLEEERRILLESENSLKVRVDQKEAHIETLRLNVLETERALQATQEKFYQNQNQIRLLENTMGHLEAQIQDLTLRQEKNTHDLAQMAHLLENLQAQHDQSQEALDLIRAEEIELKGVLQELESSLQLVQNQVADLNQQIQTVQGQLAERSSQIVNGEMLLGKDQQAKAEIVSRMEETKSEFGAITDRIAELRSHFKTQEEEVEGLRQMHLELGTKAKQSGEDLESTIAQKSRLDIDLNEKRQRAASLVSRHQVLSELEKNYEGLQEGPKALLQKHRSPGFKGFLAELISVPKAYEAAVEVVLGEKLQLIVSENQGEVGQALEQLKQQEMGRASFLALDMASGPTNLAHSLPNMPGVLGFLESFVSVEGAYADAMGRLLAGVVLVENMAQGLALWTAQPQQWTVVTLDGEMIDARGVISGGRSKIGDNQQSLLGRKAAIRDLVLEIESAKQEIANLEQEHFRLNAKISAYKMEMDSLVKNHQEETVRLMQRQKDISVKREEIARHEDMYQNLHRRMGEDEESLRRISLEISETEKILEISKADKIKFAAELETLVAMRATQEAEMDSLAKQVTEKKIRDAEIREKRASLEREVERTSHEQERRTGERTLMEADQVKLSGLVEEAQAGLLRCRNESTELVTANVEVETALASIRNDYAEKTQDIKEHEDGVRVLRREQEQNAKALSESQLRQSEIQNKSERMIEKINLEFSGQLETLQSEAMQIETQAESVAEIRERLAVLEDEMRSLGEVNLSAMNEFEQLSKRHAFLSRQKEDLEHSIDTLQKTIQKVNRTSRERFKETFDAVKAKFEEIFPRLFGGGRASISLTQEDDVLEAGIEILCQPPGKKIQNVELLSGGEKALASICLILGIFLIKPSPFCLLDEVDAPLDDANITRFNELLGELAKESQLLLITHNRHTMEIAHHLYGVTMQEAGVSKTVSVELN